MSDTESRLSETFRFEGQGYTAGCVVRDSVLKDKEVGFAGLHVVRQPDEYILVHVQTTQNTPPKQAFVRSIRRATCVLESLQSAFQGALDSFNGYKTDRM